MTIVALKTYKGNCHCGAFQFSLSVPEIHEVVACNCSLCSKKGSLALFISVNDMVILKGYEGLVGYQFGDKKMTHKFCSVCGTGVMIEFDIEGVRDRRNINARTIQDLNPFELELKPFEARGGYEPPKFRGKMPEVKIEDAKIYTGGCHCGAVTLAVKTKPLSEIQIKEDNCSICQRNANTLIYPHKSQVAIHGEENITEYLFGRKFTGHCFCKICGVQTHLKIYGPPKELFEKLPMERQEMLRPQFELFPVRVPVLEGVEWEDMRVERNDVGCGGYVVG